MVFTRIVLLIAYAELHCLSHFSFLRGASHPEELINTAATLGYRALALTDECSVAGIVKAHLTAKQCGLPLIIGSEGGRITASVDADDVTAAAKGVG